MSRIDEINELYKQEVSKAIADLADPRIGFVTVIKADVTKDLKKAFVSVSFFGQNKDKSFEQLAKRTKEIQVKAAQNMATKYTPVLDFRIDENIEYADFIDQKIREINDEK